MNFNEFSQYRLFTLGSTDFTVERTITVVVFSVIFVLIVRKLKDIWLKRISNFEPGRRGALETLTRFVYYFILTFGFMILLHINGVDLTALTLLTSALGIGIGFGLQAITNNLISGVIILLERPVKVGDRIEVGNVSGDVVAISIRATTVLTNDNIAVIVPNSDFITQKVINWSFNNKNVRFNFELGVAYKNDPQNVKKILLEVVERHDGVLKSPRPDVLLKEFGDNSINFVLRVWTQEFASRPGVLRSELNYMIFDAFKNQGIEIPFPQRDIYIKEVPKNLGNKSL